MRAVDTNVLVRLLTRDDPAQVKAAEEFVRPGAWVSHLVLVDAIWVLSSVYDVEGKRLATAVEMLLEHAQLTIQDPDVVASALTRFRERPALGLSDCLILETARKAGHGPLGTFDRKLGKVEGAQRL
jgi:predicted nucleic-acid-binding protein